MTKPNTIEYYHQQAELYLQKAPAPYLCSLAIGFYQKALQIDSQDVETYLKMGKAYYDFGEMHQALECCEKVLLLDEHNIKALFYRCSWQIPICPMSIEQINACRENYRNQLIALSNYLRAADDNVLLCAFENLKLIHPLGSLFSQEYDLSELQKIYGELVCFIVQKVHSSYKEQYDPPSLASGEKIRIGFVCGRFFRNSEWKMLLSGWLSQLDKNNFSLFAYYLKEVYDDKTKEAKSYCTKFVEGPKEFTGWAESILQDHLHIIVYPEIGLNNMAVQLAALRLAPVQCTSWGLPVTSGMPTVDYYLSNQLGEFENADSNYSENLIRLPHLGSYISPLKVKSHTAREQFGLPEDKIIYFCAQPIIRYLPQYDMILPRIAKQVPNCHFVFVKRHFSFPLVQQFEKRIEQAFAQYGLEKKQYVTMLSWLSMQQYHDLCASVDIYLDTMGFSGGTSTVS